MYVDGTVCCVTDRQRARQTADRYEHLHLQILIIPSSPHVNVPEKQEIENQTPLSQLCRMKYACGLYVFSTTNVLFTTPLETNQHIDLRRAAVTR